MANSLYKKQVALTAALTLVFMFLGFVASFLGIQWERERYEPTRPAFLAKMVDEISARSHISKEQALEIVRSDSNSTYGGDIHIVSGQELRSRFPDKQFDDDSAVYASKNVAPTGWEGRPEYVIKLAGGDEYLDFTARAGRRIFTRPFWINFITLNIAVFLASTSSLFFLFYSMRAKAKLVRNVIDDMKSGNLKARFPVKKVDEVGQMMLEFNKMADEIERLVERIKATELARIKLLQELAHDLRTPVASLKNLLETMHHKESSITPKLRGELMELSITEVEYFERLVEDLLFLAQVTEPQYQADQLPVNLIDLFEEEIDAVRTRYQSTGKSIDVEKIFSSERAMVRGDAHLLRRMFRNALENAFSFAKSKIIVRQSRQNHDLEFEILDDGQGLTPQAIAAYGEKRVTRAINTSTDGRISVGLGSVIIKAIAQLHGGSVRIGNRSEGPAGPPPGGAHLRIKFKSA